MLRIMVNDSPASKLEPIGKGSIINIRIGDGDNNKIDVAKEIKIAKSKNMVKSNKSRTRFSSLIAKLAFVKLRQVFIKTPILHHFDLEYHI